MSAWFEKSPSGSILPRNETPVRCTSIGCAFAGIISSTDFNSSGRPRSVLSLSI